MSSKQVRAPMPGDPLVRQRGWMVGVGGLLALMIGVAWWSVVAARVPNGYLARRGWDVAIDGVWPFPGEELRTWLVVMAVEGALAIWVLAARVKLSLAMRSLLLAVASFIILMGLLPLAMHASAPFPQHLGWLLFATGWLLLFALVQAIAVRAQRWRQTQRMRVPVS